MKKIAHLKKFIYLFVILSAYSVYSLNSDSSSSEVNKILTNPKIPTQYIPISTENSHNIVNYHFIDRLLIKLHPYNPLIRAYTQITNYSSAIPQNIHDQLFTYQSILIEKFANCDKQEIAQGKIKYYADYFGEGELLMIDNTPKRWQQISNNSYEYTMLTIVCSLPLK